MTCLISISPSFLRRLTLLLLRLHFLSFFFQFCPLCIFLSIKYVFFPESLLNTDTRIIRAVLHVPLVSLSTGFHCNTFQSVQLLLSLLQVLLVYIASSLEVKDPESTWFFFRLFYHNSKFAYLTAMILKFKFYLFWKIMKTYEHFLMQSVLRLYQVTWSMVTSKEEATFIVPIITLPAIAATSFLVMITSPVQKTEPGMAHLLYV